MRILLDSHIFLWLLYEPHRISETIQRNVLEAEAVFLSRTSLFELTVKYSIGKLQYSPKELQEGALELGLEILEISNRHLTHYPEIKLPHKDPFDRLLTAQAASEGLTFITADRALLELKLTYTIDARDLS